MANVDEKFLDELKSGSYNRTFTESERPKLQQAAEVHGYRGPSKKKHNGVVPIRPSDKGLLKTLAKLTPCPKGATPIKVVAHVPSGNRLVGCGRGTRQL